MKAPILIASVTAFSAVAVVVAIYFYNKKKSEALEAKLATATKELALKKKQEKPLEQRVTDTNGDTQIATNIPNPSVNSAPLQNQGVALGMANGKISAVPVYSAPNAGPAIVANNSNSASNTIYPKVVPHNPSLSDATGTIPKVIALDSSLSFSRPFDTVEAPTVLSPIQSSGIDSTIYETTDQKLKRLSSMGSPGFASSSSSSRVF